MSSLKRLIHEIHRRSLWQVLLIYIGAGWVVFEIVQTVTEGLRLPQWFPVFAALLLLIGLPVVLATAFVREGEPAAIVSDPTLMPVDEASTEAARKRRLLTWRNAGLSFLIALAVWGVVATGWMLFGERATPQEVDARKSIAVLPFDNIGGAEENVAFTDGIHDDIIAHLQKIGDLKPISRTSVLGYRDTNKNLRQIADELGVTTVLEGGVQRSGERVRINAQLIDAETDEHLWAETYDENLTAENVFAIQTDIAGRIASALKAQLTPEESERIAARPTENLRAYEQYQAARQYATRLTEPLERVKARMYEEAIELDPDFALAHAALSHRYSFLYYAHGSNEEDLSKARLHADKALELDPDLAAAHIALGRYYYQGFLDYERALEHLSVARELSPQDYFVFFWLMTIQRRMGDWEAALASSEKAVELNPRSVAAAEELPVMHAWMRHYEQAIALFDRSIALDPARIYSYHWKAWAHLNTEGGAENASQDWEPLLRIRGRADAWTNPGEESYRPRSYLFYGRARLRILHEDYRDYLRQHSLEMFSGDTLNYFLSRALSFRLTGETESSRAYFDSARVILEKRADETAWESVSSPQPRADHHASLGVVYAGLGREEDAVREGKLAVEALPISRDAYMGPFLVATLAEIYTVVGEYDAAIDQLELVLSLTCPISPPLLNADPVWDPLRDQPRFQALLDEYE
jgi:TolB-like protein/Tfp pilus assembly protein PilF